MATVVNHKRIVALLACLGAFGAVASDQPQGEIIVVSTAEGVESRYLTRLGGAAVAASAAPLDAQTAQQERPLPAAPEIAPAPEPVVAVTPPAPPAPPVGVPARVFEVARGELASTVFARWLAMDGLQLAWLADRDLSIEAAARFRAEKAADAVQSLVAVLSRNHPELIVEQYDNDVIVVNWRIK